MPPIRLIPESTYWKARTFVKRGLVKLIKCDTGHLEFSVNSHTVFRNNSGSWSCCAARKTTEKVKDTLQGSVIRTVWTKKGCILFGKGKTCSHILACKLWLKCKDLEE